MVLSIRNWFGWQLREGREQCGLDGRRDSLSEVLSCVHRKEKKAGVVCDGGRAGAKVWSERLGKPGFWNECLCEYVDCPDQALFLYMFSYFYVYGLYISASEEVGWTIRHVFLSNHKLRFHTGSGTALPRGAAVDSRVREYEELPPPQLHLHQGSVT